jgi:hypothetical protein
MSALAKPSRSRKVVVSGIALVGATALALAGC